MQFSYRALKANGDSASGTIEATALPAAIELLQRRGLAPFRIEPISAARRRLGFEGWSRSKLNLRDRGRLIRQIGTLIGAGIALDRALLLAGVDSKDGKPLPALENAHAALVAGAPLSRSLAQSGAGFTPAETGLVRAGEQSGNLAAALSELAASLERQHDARGKLASAFIFPAFLLCLAPISLTIIALVLVPNIAPLFENSQAAMPLVLRPMVFVTGEVAERGLVWLSLMLLLALAGVWAARRPGFRNGLRNLTARMPLLGPFLRRRELARLSFTLASLLSGGMALQAALAQAQDVASQSGSRTGLAKAIESISSGKRLSDALRHVPCFDRAALQLVAAGEDSNRLPDMLRYIGASEEKASEHSIERFMTILTPLLTVAIGLLVGGIVMSVMQAILAVNEIAVR